MRRVVAAHFKRLARPCQIVESVWNILRLRKVEYVSKTHTHQYYNAERVTWHFAQRDNNI